MPAKIRHTNILKTIGFEGDLDEFRRVLAEVKDDLFPDVTDEKLCYTRDEAGAYCGEVRKRP